VSYAQDDSAVRTEPLRALGYRYLTVQVWDVDAEHAGIVARGGTEGRPPVTLGTTARVSFVRDPDGNWIEVSQRASLTGALDEPERA
jgi:lactoylglutathione lyase